MSDNVSPVAQPSPSGEGTGAGTRPRGLGRLPLYYGWVVVAIAFITMGVGANVRTSFSLLYPPILAEFGWDRGATAGIFSVGFVFSLVLSPFIGMLINRFGPAPVLSGGALAVSGGLILTTYAASPFELLLTLGAGVIGASVTLAYISHSYLLPYWFVRRRGLAIGIAFSGVGIASILLLPFLQAIITEDGWRDACWAMAILLLAVVFPLNLFFQRRRPADLGLAPDGDGRPGRNAERKPVDNVVDREWADRDWSLASAARTARFWWVAVGYFTGMYAWYAVQVHQTKYLAEIGYSEALAAYALGMVGFMGVGGQIAIGALSDRIGREWGWTISTVGFVLCYCILFVMQDHPGPVLVWGMVAAQGVLGYGMATMYPTIMVELFQSRRYGQIFGVLGAISGLGSATGPWVTGELFDLTGTYNAGWAAALAACVISIAAIWLAAPRKVRLVSGKAARRAPA